MDFTELYDKLSPALKHIARSRNYCSNSIDEDDLHQEMCIYLWRNYKDGVPAGINEAYIIKGCEFHILNYIRTEKDRVYLQSLEAPLDGEGHILKDILPDKEESLDRYVDKKITIDEIKKNGFTKREKEVFSLLLEGYTTREAGKRLGISHVMVSKLKKRLINKWQQKRVTKSRGFLLI